MKKRYIESVTFDAVIKGKVYKDVVLDYRYDDGTTDVEEYEIHDEDGPWCTADLEGEDYVCDFQVWADPDEPEKLQIQCCEMYKRDGLWHHGEFLYECYEEFEYSNIRVKVIEK